MVVNFVDAVYKRGETGTSRPPKRMLKHMSTPNMETVLDLSKGCLDQVVYISTIQS